MTREDLIRINNDVNGNPRYVVHYLAFNNESGKTASYGEALLIAKKLFGGRKYNTKSYGGGIVFSSYNVKCELELINNWNKSHEDI